MRASTVQQNKNKQPEKKQAATPRRKGEATVEIKTQDSDMFLPRSRSCIVSFLPCLARGGQPRLPRREDRPGDCSCYWLCWKCTCDYANQKDEMGPRDTNHMIFSLNTILNSAQKRCARQREPRNGESFPFMTRSKTFLTRRENFPFACARHVRLCAKILNDEGIDRTLTLPTQKHEVWLRFSCCLSHFK